MSKNIIQTIGQHVFKYDPPEYTEKTTPVLAKNPEKRVKGIEKYQFLGSGYYFWDNNIERAHKWGQQHYNGKYKILELPLELKGDHFLDLVGSREDIMTLVNALKEIENNIPDLKLGAFFHVMQIIEKYRPGSWPYTIIRALNVKSNADKIPFNHIKGSRMLLDPEIIICFYEKKELNLQGIRYIDKKDS